MADDLLEAPFNDTIKQNNEHLRILFLLDSFKAQCQAASASMVQADRIQIITSHKMQAIKTKASSIWSGMH